MTNAQQEVLGTFSRFARQNGIIENSSFRNNINTGLQYLQAESYEKAAEEFSDACLVSPRHPSANFYFAVSLFSLKEYTLGGKVLRRTTHLYPDWKNLALDTSSLLPESFEFIAKLREFESWLTSSPQPSEQYFLFAFLCQFSENNLKHKAESAYQLILARDPSFHEARFFLSILKNQPIVGVTPGLSDLESKGSASFREGDYDAAINFYSDAYLFYPESYHNLYPLAHSLCAKQYFSHAAVFLRKALQSAPEKFDRQFGLRETFVNPQQFDQVLHTIEQSLEKQGNADLLLLLSYLYLTIGENKRAEFALNLLKRSVQGDLEADFLWNKSQKEPPQKKEIPPLRQENLEDNNKENPLDIPENIPEKQPQPQEDDPILTEGLQAFKSKDYKKAAESFVKATVKNPRDLKVQSFLAMTTFAMGQYPYTYKVVRSLIQTPQLRENPLAWEPFYANKEAFEADVRSLNVWIRDHPDDTDSLFVLGYVLFSNNKKRQAKVIFDRLITRIPNDPDIVFYRQAASQ